MTQTIREPDDPRFTPIMLRRELLGIGWKDQTIKKALQEGRIHKVRYGAYVDGPTWRKLDAASCHEVMTRAVLRQSRTDLVVSHTSALVLYDVPLWDLSLDRVHATRRDGKAGRKVAELAQHCGELRPEDVSERHGLAVTSPTRAGLELTTIADLEHSLCVINHLLHTKLSTTKQLHEGAVFMKDWPDTLSTPLVLSLADPRIESIGETRSYVMCLLQSLPLPQPQHELFHAGRLVARLDFAWPEFGVWLEFDGKAKYQELLRDGESVTDVVLREKAREKLIYDLTGWQCIRVTWADLMHPERTAARILALLMSSRNAR